MARVDIPLSGLAPRDLLRLLFRRKTAILAFYGGVLLAAALYCFLWPPTYEASVRILVNHNREERIISSDQESVRTVSRRPVTESDLNDEAEIIQSASVLEKTVSDLDLQNLPQHWLLRLVGMPSRAIRWTYNWYHGKANPDAFAGAVRRLHDKLSVTPEKKSAVLELRFRWGDRNMAARILQSIQENYLVHRRDVTKVPDTRTFFAAQAEEKRTQLASIEKEMDAIEPGATPDSVRVAQDLKSRQAAELEGRWRRARTGRAEANATRKAYEEALATIPDRLAYEERPLFSDQALGSLKARVLDLRLRQTELLQKYQPESRMVAQNKEELARAESMLAAELDAPATVQTTNVNSVAQSLEEKALEEQSQAAGHDALARATWMELLQVKEELDTLNRRSVLIRGLDRDRRAAELAYLAYVKRAEDARIDDRLNHLLTFNVAAIEPVRAGFSPVRPNSRLILKLALALGLVLAVGFAFLLEHWDRRVTSEQDIEGHFGVPVIASFDVDGDGADEDRVMPLPPSSPGAPH